MLIGFPVPKKVGDEPHELVWKALILPTLSHGKHFANGFRKGENGWVKRDFDVVLTNDTPLLWIKTANWSSRTLLARGRYISEVTNKRFLLLGAGSLSSFICEQLVRNGINSITIMDSDTFNAGNLSRHTLTIKDVGRLKAEALAEHLNATNMYARVKAVCKDFDLNNVAYLDNADVIIDCTANDEVLNIISTHNFSSKTIFITASFGFEAEFLYIAASRAIEFSHTAYLDKFTPAINNHMKNYPWDNIPWEGVGCWSPVFPATTSDVMLASTIAVNTIINYLNIKEKELKHFIFAKNFNDGGYLIGYKDVSHEV